MRNIFLELQVIHEVLQKGGPVAVLGGIAVLSLGFVLGRMGMVLVGAIITIVGAVEYVLIRILGNRRSN